MNQHNEHVYLEIKFFSIQFFCSMESFFFIVITTIYEYISLACGFTRVVIIKLICHDYKSQFKNSAVKV